MRYRWEMAPDLCCKSSSSLQIISNHEYTDDVGRSSHDWGLGLVREKLGRSNQLWRQCFSNLIMLRITWRAWWHAGPCSQSFWFSKSELGLRMSNCNNFPSDAAGLGITLWKLLSAYKVGPRMPGKHTPNCVAASDMVPNEVTPSPWVWTGHSDLLPSKRMKQKWSEVPSILKVWETLSSILLASLFLTYLLTLMQPADTGATRHRGPCGKEPREAAS